MTRKSEYVPWLAPLSYKELVKRAVAEALLLCGVATIVLASVPWLPKHLERLVHIGLAEHNAPRTIGLLLVVQVLVSAATIALMGRRDGKPSRWEMLLIHRPAEMVFTLASATAAITAAYGIAVFLWSLYARELVHAQTALGIVGLVTVGLIAVHLLQLVAWQVSRAPWAEYSTIKPLAERPRLFGAIISGVLIVLLVFAWFDWLP